MTLLCNITHPTYNEQSGEWLKWRLTYKGGREFINQYLEKYSNREDDVDFDKRKKISYCPAFAKAALNDVKNSIYQRISEVVRKGGSRTYQDSIAGLKGGVDLKGNSMDSFIGCKILPELLSMGEVGIYVDMPDVTGLTVSDAKGKRPYVYMYPIEDIRCWVDDDTEVDPQYSAILLREYIYDCEETTKFPCGTVCNYRYLWKENGVVYAKIFDKDQDIEKAPIIQLGIKRIPFVKVKITHSLLIDIADYQISLLNLASSDMGYALKSNFPFYTEQYDPKSFGSPYLLPPGGGNVDGTAGNKTTEEPGRDAEINVGAATGRRYPLGTDRPDFINPSPEPLQVSMEKQEQLKVEIRTLLNLSISNLRPSNRASADSKAADNQGLENGLSYIGLELEFAERQIAEIWDEYEGTNQLATVNYPKEYSLKTDQERRTEAKETIELREEIPSKTYKKEVSKEAARILLGNKVERETLSKILNEIESAEYIASDPETIRSDVEAGLLDLNLASKIRGYPEGTADRAKEDHADRLARISEAQSKGEPANPGARGLKDQEQNPGQGGKQEKQSSREVTKNDSTKDPVRGKGK